jgi:hypothetical protein
MRSGVHGVAAGDGFGLANGLREQLGGFADQRGIDGSPQFFL